MRRIAGLPGWLLLTVWIAVPVVAVVLVVGQLRGGDEASGSTLLGSVDVQTDDLVAQREAAGLPDCAGVDDSGAPVDGGLPDLTLPCLGADGDVAMGGLRGPLLVNVWAQNCPPCREELPLLQRAHDSGAVDVLGVDYQDTQPALALKLAELVGLTYPSVADPDTALKAQYRVSAIPMTLFVDADGSVTHVERDYFRSWSDLRDAVDEHLGVRL